MPFHITFQSRGADNKSHVQIQHAQHGLPQINSNASKQEGEKHNGRAEFQNPCSQTPQPAAEWRNMHRRQYLSCRSGGRSAIHRKENLVGNLEEPVLCIKMRCESVDNLHIMEKLEDRPSTRVPETRREV